MKPDLVHVLLAAVAAGSALGLLLICLHYKVPLAEIGLAGVPILTTVGMAFTRKLGGSCSSSGIRRLPPR